MGGGWERQVEEEREGTERERETLTQVEEWSEGKWDGNEVQSRLNRRHRHINYPQIAWVQEVVCVCFWFLQVCVLTVADRLWTQCFTVMEDFPAVFPCLRRALLNFLCETICNKTEQKQTLKYQHRPSSPLWLLMFLQAEVRGVPGVPATLLTKIMNDDSQWDQQCKQLCHCQLQRVIWFCVNTWRSEVIHTCFLLEDDDLNVY